MDSDDPGPELNDFSKGLGSRWCLAERGGEPPRRMGLAGGLVAVAGRGDCTAIMLEADGGMVVVVFQGDGAVVVVSSKGDDGEVWSRWRRVDGATIRKEENLVSTSWCGDPEWS